MRQMSLSLEPGLSSKHLTLRDCLLARVYDRGHGKCAQDMDMAPSKLTEKLAGGSTDGKPRGITLDEFERYLSKTKDMTPLFYLVDKYLSDNDVRRDEALAKVTGLLESLPAMLAAAGIAPTRNRS